MKIAVVFQRAALIWKIYHCPWEKGSRRLISRKEKCFFHKKNKLYSKNIIQERYGCYGNKKQSHLIMRN